LRLTARAGVPSALGLAIPISNQLTPR